MSRGEPEAAPRKLKHIPGLDGLRGLAVAAVVLFHGGYLNGGYLGVDLFFVLSGFLITSLLVLEVDGTKTIGLVRFWGRRAKRLLPALGVMLIGVAIYAAVLADSGELHRIRWDGVATLLYVANWREIFTKADYWSLYSAPSPLMHTWSLAIEEQFYLLWPLVLGGVIWIVHHRHTVSESDLGNRRFRQNLVVVIVGASALSFGLQAFWQHLRGWNRVYYGTDTRALALLVGALVAVGGESVQRLDRRCGRFGLNVIGVPGMVILGVAWVTFDGKSWFVQHGGLALVSLAAAGVVATVVHREHSLLASIVAWKPLRLLGLISYGVYLYHWPIFVALTEQRVHLSGPALFGARMIVTLAVSVVSYRFVEQPIRHSARWPLRRSLVVPSGAFATVLVLVVVSTAGAIHNNAADISAEALAKAKSSATSNDPTVMVIGDSVGMYLVLDGLKHVKTQPPINLINDTYVGCEYPPAPKLIDFGGNHSTARSCERKWQEVVAAYGVDHVIYIRTGLSAAREYVNGTWMQTCSSAFATYYREQLSKQIEGFATRGARTVLVTSLPSLLRVMGEPKHARRYWSTVECGNNVLRDVAREYPKKVVLVDLYKKFCPRELDCATTWRGETLRQDTTHYRGRSAELIAALILNNAGIQAHPK